MPESLDLNIRKARRRARYGKGRVAQTRRNATSEEYLSTRAALAQIVHLADGTIITLGDTGHISIITEEGKDA